MTNPDRRMMNESKMLLFRFLSPLIAPALLLLLFINSTAAGADALDRIQPRVDRHSYQSFLEQLPLDEGQQDVATVLYTDYAVALQALADQLHLDEKAAGGPRLEDHLTGRAPLDAESLQRIQSQIHASRSAAAVRAHQLVRDLIENTRLMMDVPDEHFESALRPLRRSVYLVPLRAGEMDETYAGEGVDLIALAGEASAPGQELEQVDPASLQRVLEPYGLRMDELLRSMADSEAVSGRTPGQIPIEQWQAIYALNQAAARDLARLAAADAGQDAERRWLNRFDRASFPWLFTKTMPERALEWIDRRDLDEQKRAKAHEIIASYQSERHQISRELIDLLLDARLSHGVILHARLSPSDLARGLERLYQSMMRNSGRRSSLDREASDALGALLTDAQRKQMKSDLAAAAYGRRP